MILARYKITNYLLVGVEMFLANFVTYVLIVFEFLLDAVRKLCSGLSPPPPPDDTSFRPSLSTDANDVDDSPATSTFLNSPAIRNGRRRRLPSVDLRSSAPADVETLNDQRPQKPYLTIDDVGLRTPSDNKSVVRDAIDVGRIRYRSQTSRFDNEFVTGALIAAGDFGELYRCTNLLDGVAYAVKKTKETVHRNREVRAHSTIGRHPNIVSYFSAWRERDHIYIQTELCDGGTLERMIHESDRVFCDGALRRLLCHVCKGLAHIHSNGLAHLDIRSANILICRMGGAFLFARQPDDVETIDRDIVYKIGNFGRLVHVEDDVQTIEREDCQNLPKELLCDDFSQLQKTDMFSTAIVVYEAATKNRLPEDILELADGFWLPKTPVYSMSLKRILKKMVDSDPIKRPNASAVVKRLFNKAVIQQDDTELWEFSCKSFVGTPSTTN